MSGEPRTLEDRVLFGVLLALGDFEFDDVPQPQRGALLLRLAEWHAHDASSAIHSATGWLLRRWSHGDIAKRIDETPLAYSPEREWFTLKFEAYDPEASARKNVALTNQPEVSATHASTGAAEEPMTEIENPKPKIQNRLPFYITFVVLPPGKYLLGSPDAEAERHSDERHHEVKITRSFAIGDREITWAQYNPFRGVAWHHAVENQFGRKIALDEPASGVFWFEAVNYCRWLTRLAGMAASEQCYADPDLLMKAGQGKLKDWPVDLAKHGFRLPTEAEWEIACRGGTTAAWSFGNDSQLLAHYAWFIENSAKWSQAVGQLRPNPRGLFDLHGNLWEWCHDWYGSSYMDDAVDPLGTETGASRAARGGGWGSDAADCRTANRGLNKPAIRFHNLGFRPALVPFSASEFNLPNERDLGAP